MNTSGGGAQGATKSIGLKQHWKISRRSTFLPLVSAIRILTLWFREFYNCEYRDRAQDSAVNVIINRELFMSKQFIFVRHEIERKEREGGGWGEVSLVSVRQSDLMDTSVTAPRSELKFNFPILSFGLYQSWLWCILAVAVTNECPLFPLILTTDIHHRRGMTQFRVTATQFKSIWPNSR